MTRLIARRCPTPWYEVSTDTPCLAVERTMLTVSWMRRRYSPVVASPPLGSPGINRPREAARPPPILSTMLPGAQHGEVGHALLTFP